MKLIHGGRKKVNPGTSV